MGIVTRLYRIFKGRIYVSGPDFRGKDWINRNFLKLVDRVEDSPEREPVNVLDRDWDNLIVLDACRADVYREVRGDDSIDSIVSTGSHSREWVENTFSKADEKLDLVYVSGNPHIREGAFEQFTGRKLDDTFEVVYSSYLNGSDEMEGFHPEIVVRDARSAEKLYPDKRKIIHFMQPHFPFVGSEHDICKEELEREEVDAGKLREAYRDNLEFVLEHVDRMVEEDLEGRTVITADHGEYLGENHLYDHLYGVNSEELRLVPWHVVKEG